LGRVDHQVKVRGYRVELGEVEAVMRREAGVDAAIAIGWPPADESGSVADGIVGFLDDASVDTTALRERMSAHLPSYMLPREFRVVDEWPLNVNGKIDRKALEASLA
jgi:acyl-coenzyme A synthetase/AMP-(fatty) acid ligase